MFKLFASSLLVLAFSSFAQADDKVMGACAADIAQFCQGVEQGGGRIMKCLHENSDKLSAECKATRDKMKAAYKEVKEACHEDFEKFCGDVKPGKKRIMKCMKEHKEELSAGCKAEMEQMKAKHKGHKGS